MMTQLTKSMRPAIQNWANKALFKIHIPAYLSFKLLLPKATIKVLKKINLSGKLYLLALSNFFITKVDRYNIHEKIFFYKLILTIGNMVDECLGSR